MGGRGIEEIRSEARSGTDGERKQVIINVSTVSDSELNRRIECNG